MTCRVATRTDYDCLGQIMFRAIREGPSPYTDAQRRAWMPRVNAGPGWAARLAQHHVVLSAEGPDIVGFMTVDPAGYIDLAYILPDARGQGRFAQLLDAVTEHARARTCAGLCTHASLMAQPAFARHGFRVVRQETVIRSGETLRRAEMYKSLKKEA
ncbi:GNAT family N-acetyltransferase [Marivita sp. S6314]|uniref:GNAT family N-acetyltransferase n=1 Tax=Marivita sp. S6314 TaxID=2926406 RepID=UPI001FF39C5F|nr:GNAT family N-acetyltransferase [Marivita sp. S6314]MCK0149092.1 GNAT family N-acetyltransferase [Marivita sp. S6314]